MKNSKENWKILNSFGVFPNNLSVGGNLYLRGTGITALPDNLSVGGTLDLRGTGIEPLLKDERAYKLYRAGDRYIAGCRNFSKKQAIKHWSSPDYPDSKRGKKFVRAIKAEEKRQKLACAE